MDILYVIIIFVFGACIGSFLNVCIYRMPRGESIVYPGSRCPECKRHIAWRDNIPLFSFINLRGKCRTCGVAFSYRYFLIEFLTAVLFVFLLNRYGMTVQFFVYSALFASLIAVTFIDFDFKEIPDSISVSGIVVGTVLSLLFPFLHGSNSAMGGLLASLKGILAGGGIIYATAILGKIAFRRDAMGGGDVKLLAMIGSLLGWKLTLLTFFLAPFLGATFGIIVKLKTGESEIPYGPFLSMAAFIALVWGENIIRTIYFY